MTGLGKPRKCPRISKSRQTNTEIRAHPLWDRGGEDPEKSKENLTGTRSRSITLSVFRTSAPVNGASNMISRQLC